MYKNIIGLISFIILITIACKNQANEDGIVEIRPDDISSIIRNPVSANKPTDTINVAKMYFEEMVYDFGTVNEGDMVKHTFEFTNTGKVALVISNAKSTCGCTVPTYPKHPITPGAKGKIEVEFNTAQKPNYQEKPISITANTYPGTTVLKLKGKVNPKQN